MLPTGSERCSFGCGGVTREGSVCADCSKTIRRTLATIDMRKIAKDLDRDPGDGWSYDPDTCLWRHVGGHTMEDERLTMAALRKRDAGDFDP